MLRYWRKSLALGSLSSMNLDGTVSCRLDDEAIEDVLRATRSHIGAIALRTFNVPEGLVRTCTLQDEEARLPGEDLAELHIAGLVSARNGFRLAAVNTEAPVKYRQFRIARFTFPGVRLLR